MGFCSSTMVQHKLRQLQWPMRYSRGWKGLGCTLLKQRFILIKKKQVLNTFIWWMYSAKEARRWVKIMHLWCRKVRENVANIENLIYTREQRDTSSVLFNQKYWRSEPPFLAFFVFFKILLKAYSTNRSERCISRTAHLIHFKVFSSLPTHGPTWALRSAVGGCWFQFSPQCAKRNRKRASQKVSSRQHLQKN